MLSTINKIQKLNKVKQEAEITQQDNDKILIEIGLEFFKTFINICHLLQIKHMSDN